MNKFVINKGMSNDFIIKIKQNGTTLPMLIDPSDTFVAKLLSLKDGSVVATPTVEVYSAENGQIKVTLSNEQVDTLEIVRGDRCDYYYSKPLYKLAIDCETVANGSFVAKISKVYVE